jgi:hypothetical protein
MPGTQQTLQLRGSFAESDRCLSSPHIGFLSGTQAVWSFGGLEMERKVECERINKVWRTSIPSVLVCTNPNGCSNLKKAENLSWGISLLPQDMQHEELLSA